MLMLGWHVVEAMGSRELVGDAGVHVAMKL
jgi:hypothetical protein